MYGKLYRFLMWMEHMFLKSAVLDGDSRKFEYTTSTISCNNKESVLIRNNHKKEVMKFLLEQDEINGIPYRLFFLCLQIWTMHYIENKILSEEEQEKILLYSFYQNVLRERRNFFH